MFSSGDKKFLNLKQLKIGIFDKFDLLTPLMTFDPDTKNNTCTPAKSGDKNS